MRAYSTLIRGLVLVLLGVLGFGGLGAQDAILQAKAVRELKVPGKARANLKAVCEDDAGQIAGFRNVQDLQSNTFGNVGPDDFVPFEDAPDIIFLCAGDNFLVDYLEGSENLSGDPVPGTRSTIAYAAYGCRPEVDGTTYDELNSEACILDLDTLDYNGLLVAIGPDLIGSNPPNYDLSIVNSLDRSPPRFPQLFYFTPITADSFNATTRQIGFESVVDPITGEELEPNCINLAIDQTFGVAFLNPLEAVSARQSGSDCSGSFTIRGGRSEFDQSTSYTEVTVRNTATGQVATLERAASSYVTGDVVRYIVPAPGTYEIVLEDNVACGYRQTVQHTAACATVEPSACLDDAGEFAGVIPQAGLKSNSLAGLATGGSVPYANLPDTIFLCANDSIVLDFLEGSENVTASDPDPSSLAGIGYGIYNPFATYSGPEFDGIVNDPNAIDKTYPAINGYQTTTPPGYSAGDYSLPVRNVESAPGQSVRSLNTVNGRPSPIFFTFSPITADKLSGSGNIAQEPITDPVTNEESFCINVSTDQRITVGFLNPVTLVQQNTSSCNGSFQLFGGVSEVTANPYGGYNINLTGPSGNVPLPNGAFGYRHGDVIEYTVDAEGIYSLTVEDQVSCGFSITFEVTEGCAEEEEPTNPTANLTIEASPTDVTCTGDSDGSIVVTANGGTAPYTVTYIRTNPTAATGSGRIAADGGSFTFPDLPTGFYDIEVVDAGGITQTITGERIDEGSPFDVIIETVPGGDCSAGNQATLVAVVSVDGDRIANPTTQGYTISWSTGATTDTILAAPNQTYTVTVENTASGCENLASVTPSQASTLIIDIDNSPTADATCSGSLDGSVTVQVSGGVPGNDGQFEFEWSDGVTLRGGRTAQRANLNPGSYTVIVTDLNGCSDTRTFTVAAEKTLVANLSSTQVECFGESNGTISVRASTEGAGASLPYRAAVEDATGAQVAPFQTLAGNGSTPETFEGFAAGTYIVVLQDSDPQQCETRDTIIVTEPAELSLSVETTSPICPEDPEGTATLVVSGGTGPYTFRVINDSLPDLVDSLMTFDTLLVDTNFLDTLRPSPFYIAIIDDANGCGPDSLQFEIKPRPQPRVTNALFTTISCPGDSDGQLSAIVSPPPGDSIEITDYAWYRLNEDNSKGEQVVVGRTTEPNLTVGAYLLEVTLSNDCVWPFPGFVDSPGLVSLDSVAITDPTCLGDTDGSIELFPVGGTPSADGTYNYRWSDLDAPITEATRTDLSAGPYSVTISDANNCQPAFETTFEVEDPNGIVGEFTAVEDVSCPDDTTQDGRITFVPRFTNDSIGTFDFFWSTGDTIRGETTSSLSGLARGPISVTVTDGVCPQVFDTLIGSPDEFAFDPIITDATCNGDSTGAAEILVTGGTPGYTFSYVDRPEITNQLENVSAGLYQLLVTDANGCQADTFSFVINQPDSLALAIDPFVTTPRVTCFGDEDGVLAVQVVSTNNNPLGDNPYSWSPAVAGTNESSADELAPGTYGVTVTDEAGCQDSLSYTIFEPDPITFTIDSIADPLCFNDPAEVRLDTAFGGQGSDLFDYNFTINGDGFLTPFDQVGLGFGDSVVIAVFDSVGCSSEQTFQIQQPDEIVIDLPNRLIVELGDSSTQLDPLISPGGRDYRYRWTAPRFEPPVPFLSNDSIRDPFLIVPTQNVEYTLTVTDENGCQAIDDIFVEIDANRNIFIPNAFSPNMDGRNDDFRIYACTGVVGITKVNIFNRWGGLLFEQDNIPSSCLDGTLLWNGQTPDGREVDPGVYVYTVEVLFIDGVTLLYRGDIAVVR